MKNNRIVAIDIGNSSTNLALFEADALIEYDFFPSAPEYCDKICHTIENWQSNFHHIVIGSVVPSLGDMLETRIKEHHNTTPMMVEDFKTKLVPLKVDRPETVGVDRIVNSYAAIHLFGTPAFVVSLGTATTFEVINKEGEYIGGAIAPGIKISLEALTQRTALLPPAMFEKPREIIAKNTLDHMKSGIYYGSLGSIEGMVSRMKSALGEDATVIGTGGMSALFAEERVFDRHEPYLNLKGLELIHRRYCQF